MKFGECKQGTNLGDAMDRKELLEVSAIAVRKLSPAYSGRGRGEERCVLYTGFTLGFH